MALANAHMLPCKEQHGQAKMHQRCVKLAKLNISWFCWLCAGFGHHCGFDPDDLDASIDKREVDECPICLSLIFHLVLLFDVKHSLLQVD